ncbi:putative RnaseH ribonuclease [Campylobacter phage F336]|uniref:Putative RnaseH ribonuclease n=1 Tax=Campylobacter phage F336 TaxID=2794361 RepID=A0A7T3KD95_9CAUD|nr:putative RnaseH ribonuclease [Campylobacter phage F336]
MQLLINKHITLFKPIKKEFFKNIEEPEITKTLTMHILLGDKADNIPSIMEGTIFTPDFIKFLENNGIFETDVNNFNKLEISKHYMIYILSSLKNHLLNQLILVK